MRRLPILASLSIGALIAVGCTSAVSTPVPGTPAGSPVPPQSVDPEPSAPESVTASVALPSLPPLPSVDIPSLPPLPSVDIPSPPPLPSFSIPSLPPPPSVSVPSFEPDTELEGLFPSEVLGAPVTVQTLNAEAFLGFLPPDSEERADFEAFVGSLGVGVDAISVGSGRFEHEGSDEEINAFRAAGVETRRLFQSLLAFAQSSSDDPGAISLKEAVVGGKSVTVVTDSAAETTSYFYGVQDVVFIVETESPAVAEAVMGALP